MISCPWPFGIDKDVFRLVNEEHFPGASKKVVRKTLAMHARHGRHPQAPVQGGARYHPDGSEEGDITPQQQHHVARLKRNRASYWGGIAGTTERRRGMVLHTPKPCSCWLCGNGRKHHGLTSRKGGNSNHEP